MNIARLISILSFLIFFATSCLNEGQRELEIKDLVGVWEDSSQGTTFIEEWHLNPDGSLSGNGFVLQSSDTVFIEYLNIRDFNGVLTYTAQISDHNEGRAIPFSLKERKVNTMVFENMNHDFPQRIIYELPSDSTMEVFIEGRENGVYRKRKLSFLKRSE